MYLQVSGESHVCDIDGLWAVAMAWIIGCLVEKNTLTVFNNM